MEQAKIKALKQTAAKVRLGVLEAVFSASSGHPGGSLSITDILTYLYFEEMNINPAEPKMEGRDRLVLSKGHTAPALYSVLANRGYFDVDLLKTFRQVDSILQGHPDMKHIPGVEMTTGSLGLGISAACGMALAAKIDGKDYRTYAMLGDGETQEGQVWEALMFGAHYKLDNLCIVIDWNGLQIDGRITDVMNPTPYDKKLEAFGWNVISIDGHDFEQIAAAFDAAKACKGKPTAIIATTTKGKGVSFMEDQASWHGTAPNAEQYAQAVAEIKAAVAE
ncbi:MAG: transketolase [Ruminococcaceae bacterium]|nr:transketolase [Oscillospiraceae bacterium]